MLRTRQAVCMKCSHTFAVDEETSRKAHLLHCVRCGKAKRMGLAELKEYYYRYFGTLLNRAEENIRKKPESVHPIFSHELLDMRKYVLMVEHQAGSCVCGAVFRFSGKPRCPVCRSTVLRIERTKPSILPAALAGNA